MYHDPMVNMLLARCCAVLFAILTVKWPVRVLSQKKWAGQALFKKINTVMRITHVPMGIAMVTAGWIHGYLSFFPLIGLNTGSICWLATLLTAACWFLRKPLNGFIPWIKLHRWLTLVAIALLAAHIAAAKGYLPFD